MKKLIVMSLTSCLFSLMGCNAQNAKFKTVGTDDFAKVIADTNIVVLDVRTAEEYQAGHIERAINIDVLEDDFEQKARAEIQEGKTIALYWRSGNRSKKAAALLSEKYKVIELGTGYNGWVAANGKK